LVGDHPLEAQIFLLQPLQPLRLIHAQPPILFFPAVVRLLGDPELPTCVKYRQAFAGVELKPSADVEESLRAYPVAWA
jgi:hypothetical protein